MSAGIGLLLILTALPSLTGAQQQQQQAAPPPRVGCITTTAPGKQPQTVCADKSCKAIPAWLGGNVLVLSVGSMIYLHGGYAAPGSDPADCCERCKATDNCNAWSFCTRPSGCGKPNSCSDYSRSLPPKAGGGNAGNTPLPARGFGQYGPWCVPRNGTFPYQMCTLWALEDAQKPQVVAFGDVAYGWISGIMPRQSPAMPGCPLNFTAETCAKCLGSKSPEKCFACMSQFQLLGGTGADNCAACANLTSSSSQAACVSCLKDYPTLTEGCSSCLQFQTYNDREVNVNASEACFACVAGSGPSRRGSQACSNCFNFNNGNMNLTRCLACAADSSLSPGAASACYSCHTAAVFDTSGCLSCLRQFPASAGTKDQTDQAASCGGCAEASLQQATGQCYSCVRNAGPSGASFCSNLGTTPDAEVPPDIKATIPDYYRCLQGTNWFAEGGSYCFACLSPFESSAASRKCLDCVGTLNRKPWAQLCSSCFQSGLVASPEQCQACLFNSSSMADGNKCIVR